MTNLDSIFKSRDISLPTKVCIFKAMVFPAVMYGCENWTVMKTEHRRIDAFEPWCWRRHLRVPWTARRSNQSILKEINPGISLEGMMLKLKLQYFGHLIRRVDSLEKTLMLGGIGGRRRRGRQTMRWLDGITDWMDASLSELRRDWWWTGRPGMLRFMGSQRVGHDWVTKLNCTELRPIKSKKTILLHLYLFFPQSSFFLHVEKIFSFKHLTYIIFSLCWRWKLRSLSHVQLFAIPWTVVLGIHQARILEWVAYPFSSGSPWFRSQTRVSCTAGRFFTNWAMREAPSSMLRISVNISCRQV